MFKKRGKKKKKGKKRDRATLRSSTTSTQLDDDDTVADVVSAASIMRKKPRLGAHSTASSGWGAKSEKQKAFLPGAASTKDAMAAVRGGATDFGTSTETEENRDARTVAMKNIELNESGQVDERDEEGNLIYKGAAARKNYTNKSATAITSNKFTGTQGPLRAPKFFRKANIFDYQQDICKDYKDSGYCGFGDTCIYMHIRGGKDVTKSGAQIEKEWDEKQKQKNAGEEDDDGDGEAVGNAWDVRNLRGGGAGGKKKKAEEFPHACFICRKGFTDPVVTRCGHYFCLKCAMARNAKGPQCAACGGNTRGIFNEAKGLKRHLALQAMREREKKSGAKSAALVAAEALTAGVAGYCTVQEVGGGAGGGGDGGGGGGGDDGWGNVDVAKEQAEADAADGDDDGGWGEVDVAKEQEEADAAAE